MSLTRKASSAAKKAIKPPRQDSAAALAEREAELAEARRQQAATAEILRVISRSPADAGPVFEAILEACQRLFGSDEIGVYTIGDDAMVRVAAWRGPRAEEVRRDVTPLAESVTGRIIRERRTHHIPDLRVDPTLSTLVRERAERLGSASLLYAPMLLEDRGLGSILVVRSPPRPFSEREQALLQTFADQAAIAIQNARLFNEVQARTKDLREALQQQTATTNVLKVISRSAFDLDAVLKTLTDSARSLSGAASAAVFLRDGDLFRLRAESGVAPEFLEFMNANPARPGKATLIGRVAMTGEAVQIPDVAVDSDYDYGVGPQIGDYRAMFGAPLIRDGKVEGIFGLMHPKPGAFMPRQMEMVRAFADQAVIAIENARLFDEVQGKTRDLTESLEQQTATADVLKAISRTAFDLDTVLEMLVSTAARLCGANHGQIFRRYGDVYRYAASRMDVDPAYLRHERTTEIKPGRGTLVGRVALESRTIEIADAWNDPEYAEKEEAHVGGVRAMLGVPLIRDGEPIGAFALARSEPVPFTPRQIALVQTFADQAVVAIENVRLFNETQEALERQTATADILKVIASSPTDVQPVFEAIATSANTLIGGFSTAVLRFVGDAIHLAAFTPINPAADEVLRTSFPRPMAEFPPFVLVRGGEAIQFTDTEADSVPSLNRELARLRGYRSMLTAPLMSKGAATGMISVTRREPGAFATHHVQLLKTFADQAVIAIENVRLFDEVQAKTRDLEEALQQQTATADVLKAISRSAFDLETVLESLISTAMRLCNAKQGVIFRRHGDIYRYAASHMLLDPAYRAHEQTAEIKAGRGTLIGRVALENRTVQIEDAWGDPDYAEKDEIRRTKVRSMLGVPLMRNGEPIGAFGLGREEPVPFTQRQIELVTTFADQAVIAIENVRLFDEVQARTRDLTEALQQQTATADVLKVISRSAFDLQAVFETLMKSAVDLVGAIGGALVLREGDHIRFRTSVSIDRDLPGQLTGRLTPLDRSTAAGRAILSGRLAFVPDSREDPEYVPVRASVPGRCFLSVPLMRDGRAEGALTLVAAEPNAFNERHFELVQTFADQAVIAIENVRLFEEVQARTKDLQEALQLQTATSDVLKVISRSAFDLQTVFDTLTASAVELCGAFSGSICVRDGEIYRYRGNAGPGVSVTMSQYLAEHPATPGRGSIVGRVLLLGKVEEIQDVLEDADYVVPLGTHGQASRALLGVPLLGKDGIEGALVLTRKEPGHFTPRQIEIVQTFADQAVIAIENVRLFDEVQERTKELAGSLDDLRKAQDRLIQSEKLASLGQLTAGIAHEIKNPLNFVNNFSALSRELVGELADVIKTAPLDNARREEAEELIGTIEGNLDKVVSHGKRADSIVKNMLLHSREGSGERSTTNVNAMVEEALNLAYHGARAEKPGFNVTIAKSLDPNAGAADLYPQEMTRVLLNLISNGFYATNKRKLAEPNGAYEPTLTASTRDLGHSVEIAIRDNGTGIPDEVKAKMFNPFFTTKPAGEGTGLGLSLSHDIVVKQHGGTMEVKSAVGAFTQFTIILPRTGLGL